MAVIAVGRGNESTMTAIFGLDESDAGIAFNLPSRLRSHANKRIIPRIKYVGWDRNFIHDIGRRGARIVIGSAAEPGVERRDFIVEVAQTFQPPQAA